MKSLALFEIPGLNDAMAKARAKQSLVRENSMLGLTYNLSGCMVRTMTVTDYVLLDRIGSPFLRRVEPTLEDLAVFLWIMSPQFNKWTSKEGWHRYFPTLECVAAYLHGRKIRRKFGKKIPDTSEELVVEVFGYIETMFMDSPPSVSGGQESCLSYLCSWFDAVQSTYHFPSGQVWSMALPELFQRLQAIRQRNNPNTPQFNKETDSIKLFVLRGLRSKEFTMEDLAEGRVKLPDNFSN